MSDVRRSGGSGRTKRRVSVGVIGGTGVALAGFEIWHATQMRTLLGQVIEAGLPLVMAIVMVYASFWLHRSAFDGEGAARIAGWFVAGMVGMAAVTGWIISHQVIRGVGFGHWHFVIASSMTVGGLAGFLIGVYDGGQRVQHREAERARQAIAASMDGIAILDEDGRFESVNRSHADVYGYDDPDAFLGETWHMCYTDAAVTRLEEEIMPSLEADGSWRGELTGRRLDGSAFPQEITLAERPNGGFVCVVRDVTERKEHERRLASREQRLRTIVENVPVILFAVDPDREVTLQVGKGLETAGIEQNEMVGASIDELFDSSPAVVDAIDRSLGGEPVDVTLDLWGRTYQTWYQPIESGGEVTNVIGVAMDVSERTKRERGIRALHDATREMMQAADRETICRIAVETAKDALALPMSAVWLRADDGARLEPVVVSDRAADQFGRPPTFEAGNSIAWEVYEENEPRVFDDVNEVGGRFNPETNLRSELIAPIPHYGVLISGSTDVGRFDETDVVLAQLLAANTRSALERAEREEELKRHNDRLDFFNSILRHDVSNGMMVIRGRAEFLAEELEGDQLARVETIIDWSEDIVGIIRRVRTVLETSTAEDGPELGPVDISSVLRSEVERVRATYPEVRFEADVPDDVTVMANELLGEILGNVVTNAVDHNDTDGLCVSATVDVGTGDSATVRIADNGSGVPDDRKEAIFRRHETGSTKSTGTGFGLFFVDSMVAEYGGEVRVEDNERGGATFVIDLPTP